MLYSAKWFWLNCPKVNCHYANEYCKLKSHAMITKFKNLNAQPQPTLETTNWANRTPTSLHWVQSDACIHQPLCNNLGKHIYCIKLSHSCSINANFRLPKLGCLKAGWFLLTCNKIDQPEEFNEIVFNRYWLCLAYQAVHRHVFRRLAIMLLWYMHY